MTELNKQKILITGASGQLAYSIACELAQNNRVDAIARFGNANSKERLESHGINCIKFNYVDDDLNELDSDYDYALHFATTQAPGDDDFEEAIRVNAVATGKLMYHYRQVKAFFYSSTCSVYQSKGHHPLKETDPLGDAMRPHCPIYSISKVASEAVVKFTSEQFNIPAVIARMNVSYGANGGLPVMHLEAIKKGQPIYLHSDKPNYFSPVHEKDYYRQMLKLIAIASSPPVLVNWCGSQLVSAENWCEYMGSLLAIKPNIVHTDQVFPCTPCDTTHLHSLIGETEIDWKQGMRMLVEEGATAPRLAG